MRPPDRREFLNVALSAAGAALAAPALLSRPAAAAESEAAGPPHKPAGWQIGCFTRPWGEHDYRVALDAIAEAGFKHAGLMTAKDPRLVISVDTTPEEAGEIGREVHKRGMTVPCTYGGRFNVRESLEAGIAGLRRLIDNCAAAESAALMLGGIGNEKLFDDYYRAVAECCDYAAENRVGMVLKPHGGKNATGPQLRAIVERVNHPSFTLWYDPGNILHYSDGRLDPVDDAPSVAGLVTGMCVKDFRMTEEDAKPRKEVMIDPGTGQVRFPEVMAKLRQGGFTAGPLVIECLARGELPELLANAKRAREFVERLLA
jgi:sugar phosphate isomerase/epimerase